MSDLVQEAKRFIEIVSWISEKENLNNSIDNKMDISEKYISLIDREMNEYENPSNIYYSGLGEKYKKAEFKKVLRGILIKYRSIHLPSFNTTTIYETGEYESGETLKTYKEKNNIRTLKSYEATVAELMRQLND
jgi:hypothetical protein